MRTTRATDPATEAATSNMPREGGRTCGCDPNADHVCEGHSLYRDARTWNIGGVFIQGPLDPDGRMRIYGSSENALTRFEVEDMIAELERRLRERA